MANPYREIFQAPGAKGFAAAGFVARMPMAMAPIGIVAMLSQTHGEYWLAGAVSATYALTNAVVAPQISRLVDRLGQTAVVVPTTIISVLAFVVLIAAANQDWPIWTLFVSALSGRGDAEHSGDGARALDRDLPRPPRDSTRPSPSKSAADELVYIAGASLSVGLSVALFPEAGMLASTLFLALGSAAFIAAALDRAARAGRSDHGSARLGDPAAAGPDHHLRPDLHRRDLRDRGSQRRGDHQGTRPAGRRQPRHRRLCRSARSSSASIVGALNLKMPLQRQLAIAVAIIALTTLPLLVARHGAAAGARRLRQRRGDLADLHHRLRPDRAARAGSDADRGHHLGDDRHRHRHGARSVRRRLGGRQFRRAERLLGVGGGWRSRAGHRAAGPEEPCRASGQPGARLRRSALAGQATPCRFAQQRRLATRIKSAVFKAVAFASENLRLGDPDAETLPGRHSGARARRSG